MARIGLAVDDTLDSTDGVQQYVLTLGRWLTTQGHDVFYLAGKTDRTDITVYSLGPTMHVAFNKNRLNIPLPFKRTGAKALLKELALDVLHIQLPHAPYLTGRLIKNAPNNLIIIGTFHILPAGRLESLGTRILGLVSRRQLRRFNKIIAVSPAAADFARSHYGIDPIVIPNAVETHTFMTAAKTPKNAPLKIIFLGRLVERKGAECLIAAIGQLRGLYRTPLQVVIAGTGPLRSRLEAQVRALGLAEIVTFSGFIDEAEKPTFLGSADMAIFPSTGGESFGIVLVEAMAAGASVVLAGNNPGYESILGSEPDLLIDPFDTLDFAKRIEKYLRDPKLRTTTRKWQMKAAAQYDVAIVGTKILNVYGLGNI
jgi:phosphatidylinositol alpha-mannosyltransferase